MAGWFGQYMGWYAPGEPAGFLGAVVGAVAVLAVLRLFSGAADPVPPSPCSRRWRAGAPGYARMTEPASDPQRSAQRLQWAQLDDANAVVERARWMPACAATGVPPARAAATS